MELTKGLERQEDRTIRSWGVPTGSLPKPLFKPHREVGNEGRRVVSGLVLSWAVAGQVSNISAAGGGELLPRE